MKKIWKTKNNKKKIKRFKTFSITKNKNWKKKRWEIKAKILKKRKRRQYFNHRKIMYKLKTLRKFRQYETAFNSRIIKKKQFFKKLSPIFQKIKSEYFSMTLNLKSFWKNKELWDVFFFINKKIWIKKSYFIKKLIKNNKYFFKKTYKKKTNYKFNKQFKPFLLKSLNMNLVKFSLISNITWYDFNRPHQTSLPYIWTYDFEKSRQIKLFFDWAIQRNLFNQIYNLKILQSHLLFQRLHKEKIFSEFFNKKRKFPWWETLTFKKQTYRHQLSWKSEQFWFKGKFLPFSFKFYYRYKKPWHEKRKNLYSNFSYLVLNTEHQNVISNKKQKRIKQLLNKIILPFYGNIKPAQLTALYKKSHHVKSETITSSNLLLNNLESRLDIIVYRLNLAPNVIWARRLIKAGLIFIQRKNSHKNLLLNNIIQKKKLYPLQLNGTYNFYNAEKNDSRIKKFYFKTQPIVKIDFRVQPGDIIQCHPFSMYQKWNVNKNLLNKPIPPYLLTNTKIDMDNEWNPRYRYIIRNKNYLILYSKKRKKWRKKNFNFVSYRYEWNNELLKETTSFFLFTPQKKDFLSNDRNGALFLNWIIK